MLSGVVRLIANHRSSAWSKAHQKSGPTWTVPSENSLYVSCLERPSRVFALHPRPPVGGRATKVLGAAAQKRRSQSRRYPRTLPAEWWRRGVPRRSSRHIGLLGGREP